MILFITVYSQPMRKTVYRLTGHDSVYHSSFKSVRKSVYRLKAHDFVYHIYQHAQK